MYENMWLTIKDVTYPGVIRKKAQTDRIVILFSGFGFSMSDRDYFMSRIASEISEFATVYQFDIRGHGDHAIDLEQTSLSGMKEDIYQLLKVITKAHRTPIFCIGRGISPLLCMQAAGAFEINPIQGLIGFNPYMIDHFKLQQLFCEIRVNNNKYVDFEKYLNHSAFKALLRSLGADIAYVKGESILVDFFRELEKIEANTIFNRFTGKKAFLYPKHDKDYTLEVLKGNEIMKYRKLDYREDAMLPYNSFWQSEVIHLIKKILWDWSKDNDQ